MVSNISNKPETRSLVCAVRLSPLTVASILRCYEQHGDRPASLSEAIACVAEDFLAALLVNNLAVRITDMSEAIAIINTYIKSGQVNTRTARAIAGTLRLESKRNEASCSESEQETTLGIDPSWLDMLKEVEADEQV